MRLFVAALLTVATLGGSLLLGLAVAAPSPSRAALAAGVWALAAYPVLLRRGARFERLAAAAAQHGSALVLVAAYASGALAVLMWMVAPALLAAFCLDHRPRLLTATLASLAMELLGFAAAPPPPFDGLVALALFSILGLGGFAAGLALFQSRLVRQAEVGRAANEEPYRFLADFSTDMISRFAADGTRLYVSPAVRHILGYEPQELIGKPAWVTIDPRDHAAAKAAIRGLLSGGEDNVTVTVRGVHKRGTTVWLETTLRIVWDAPGGGMSYEVVGVARDVTRRRAMEEALAVAKEEAERANRAKSDFLAGMSHELRTPLNAIMGFGEIIECEMFGAIGHPKYVEYAGDIVRCGAHLLAIITDILDFAKADAGRLTLVEETVDLQEVIDASLAMLGERARTGGVDLRSAVAPGVGAVRGDARRLRQILVNLLSNSVKFTPSGGAVDLAARVRSDGWVVLSVRDTGIGIAPTDIPRVLEPFGQIDNVLRRPAEGTGLGLPLTKRFVEMHGGSFALESAPGAGTTVTVALPPERVLKHAA